MVKITGCKTIPYSQSVADALTYQNPFEPDQEFRAFFQYAEGTMSIPRGYPLPPTEALNETVAPPVVIRTSGGYQLREYQEPAVYGAYEYLKDKPYGECLISASPGSGKSYALAKLLELFGLRTLILSHLTMLGTQITQELMNNLAEGTVSALAKGQPLADINISSFQLLDADNGLLEAIAEHIGVVVIDEAENMVTSSRLNTLFRLRPKYIILLTATPSRELMQQTSAVRYLYGGKVFYMEPPEESKIHSHHVMFDYRHLHWDSPMSQNMYKSSLHAFYKRSGIVADVIRLVQELVKCHGTTWIIVDRVKLQDEITMMLKALGISVATINGSTSSKRRAEILEDIAEDRLKVILGSAPLAAGVSIPRLAFGIRLMPNSSSEELLEQQKGRLNRHADFKLRQPPVWFDFAISGSLEYGGKKRFKLYKASTRGIQFVKLKEFITSPICR